MTRDPSVLRSQDAVRDLSLGLLGPHDRAHDFAQLRFVTAGHREDKLARLIGHGHKDTEAAAILTHLPERLDQSADYLRGFAAAPMATLAWVAYRG